MPLTEKGTKISGVNDDDSLTPTELKTLNELKNKHGHERGKEIFYSNRNKQRGDGSWKLDIEFPPERVDAIKRLVAECDALYKRMDAFETWSHQRKPKKVKPRTKDNMQPSTPHPKKIG